MTTWTTLRKHAKVRLALIASSGSRIAETAADTEGARQPRLPTAKLTVMAASSLILGVSLSACAVTLPTATESTAETAASATTSAMAEASPQATAVVATEPAHDGDALVLSCDSFREAASDVVGDLKLAKTEGPIPMGEAWIMACEWSTSVPNQQGYDMVVKIVAMVGPKLHDGVGNGAAEDCANVLKYTPGAKELPSESPIECVVRSGSRPSPVMQATSHQASISLGRECSSMQCWDSFPEDAAKAAVVALAEKAERGIVPGR